MFSRSRVKPACPKCNSSDNVVLKKSSYQLWWCNGSECKSFFFPPIQTPPNFLGGFLHDTEDPSTVPISPSPVLPPIPPARIAVLLSPKKRKGIIDFNTLEKEILKKIDLNSLNNKTSHTILRNSRNVSFINKFK